jgi:hypothetical protein
LMLDFKALGLSDDWDAALADVPVDEDVVISVAWTNATVTARAGTVRAWIEQALSE